jgi:hypothetical protein
MEMTAVNQTGNFLRFCSGWFGINFGDLGLKVRWGLNNSTNTTA